jgi:hypothetical protein
MIAYFEMINPKANKLNRKKTGPQSIAKNTYSRPEKILKIHTVVSND